MEHTLSLRSIHNKPRCMPCGKPNKQIISYIIELCLLGGRDDILPTLDESKDEFLNWIYRMIFIVIVIA